MERFAFKIDAALKANLHKICRLCGIDNPTKVPILLQNESNIIDLDEPSLSHKVFELVGFMVRKNDKMPQTMCSLCVDKINDFYEFREMCYATNKQTRKLLGLQSVEPQKLIDMQPIVNLKSMPLPVITGNKRGRKRKTEETLGRINTECHLEYIKKEREQPAITRKKQRLQQATKTEVKDELEDDIIAPCPNSVNVADKKGRKPTCSVCCEKFSTKELVEEHRMEVHVPSIPRYYCNACNQTHHSNSDIKSHHLWHKLSKAPYKCPLCDLEVANNYAYTRHLREHTIPTPVEMLVLDRECPMCKKTFITNYLYNTHPCAIRMRKCGGCNRTVTSEITYMRHAAFCAKIHLRHSKHIAPEVAKTEAQMRIKNEYGGDDAADIGTMQPVVMMKSLALPRNRCSVDDASLQPIVFVERLASPLLRAASGSNNLGATKSGKSSERVSSKKYLKRVDELLKNTISTLVSIKHEPEVHIDDTGPPSDVENTESDADDASAAGCDDFHAANHESDEDANTEADIPNVAVKHEIIDEAYETPQLQEQQQVANDGVHIKQEPKPFALKLKITKTQGQLNSSLVDNNDEEVPRSAKKKKKRKHKDSHKERNRETEVTVTKSDNCQKEALPNNVHVSIKQECLDAGYKETESQNTVAEPQHQPEATVMTSIPMTQLENNYENQEQTEFSLATPQEECVTEPEPGDVKPNRLELDRLMQITHVASGVDMAEEAIPSENAIEAVPDVSTMEQTTIQETPTKAKCSKSTARKSTGRAPCKQPGDMPAEVEPASETTPTMLPQIVSVESGATMSLENMPNVVIKSEPCGRGYADEVQQDKESSDDMNHSDKIDNESAYISTLDFGNVHVKQEKDLDLSDEHFDSSEVDECHNNGQNDSTTDDDENEDGYGDDYEDDDSASSADEAEEYANPYENQEVRIYRELELVPLEETNETEELDLQLDPQSNLGLEPGTDPVADSEPDLGTLPDPNMVTDSEPDLGTPDPNPVADSVPDLGTHPEPDSEPDLGTHPEPDSEPDLDTHPEPDSEPDLGTHPELDAEADLEHDLGTHPEPDAEVHSHPEPSTAFGFVITNVCSGVETPLIEPTSNNCDSPISEAATTHTEAISAPKDNETQAQPFFASLSCTSLASGDEEQQNVLNHELSAQHVPDMMQALSDGNVSNEPAPCAAASSSNSCVPTAVANGSEETENRINEQQQEQLQQRCQNDDSNINEIAENNNNANIERELQDDAYAAQENLNI